MGKRSFIKINQALIQVNVECDLSAEEFRVLFFVLNTFNIKGQDNIVIYRDMFSDLANTSLRTLSRVFKSLQDKELIEIEHRLIGKKTYNYFKLGDKLCQFKSSLGDKNDQLSVVYGDKMAHLNGPKWVKMEKMVENGGNVGNGKNDDNDIELPF